MGVVLFGRTRLAPATVAALAVSLLVATVLQGRTFVAPVIPWDITVLTSPLVPVVVAVVALRACEPTLHDLEGVGPQGRVVTLRLAWAGALTAALVALSATTAVLGNALVAEVAVRPVSLALSFVSFFAVGLLGSAVLGSDLGWVPPCLLAVALVFFGRDPDQVAHRWAWVLQPPTSTLAWSVPLALLVVAVTSYALVDTVGTARATTGAGR